MALVRDPHHEPQKTATQAVGAVVVDRSGRVLLVRRAKPPGHGQWTLPGGRVEPDESHEYSVVREVAEETSLRVRVIAPLGVIAIEREGFRYAIHEYLCAIDGPGAVGSASGAPAVGEPADGEHAREGAAPEPRAGDDAADARWVDPRDLRPLGVLADAQAVIERGLIEARAQNLVEA